MPIIVVPAQRRLVVFGPGGARAVYGRVPPAEAPVPPDYGIPTADNTLIFADSTLITADMEPA